MALGGYNLGTAAGRIVIDGSAAEKGFGVAQAAAQGFTGTIDQQIQQVNKIANSLLIAGAAGAGAMTIATVSAANFEERLSAIQAVSGATKKEMELVAQAALEIGAKTSFSATEAAYAFEELIKAGISVQDSLDGAADATANLAAAGEVALPRAAEIASNAMNNFALSGKEMPRIADLIAGAANASAIGVEEFGTSLSQVGAVASIAGVSFQDTSVAIAEMGNAGIKGSDAGTSLKTMFLNLIPSTNRQIDKFKELGLYTVDATKATEQLTRMGYAPLSGSLNDVTRAMGQYIEDMGGSTLGTAENTKEALELSQKMGLVSNSFFDANGKMKSLAEVQQILQDTTSGMTDEQKLFNLEMLFGADAVRAAAVMSREGAAGYDEMYSAMSKVTAADVAATRLDNLKGSQEELSGSLETLWISIGRYFLPPLKSMTDAVTAFINVFNAMPQWTKAAAAGMLALFTTLSLALGVLPKLVFWAFNLAKAWLAQSALKAFIATLLNLRAAAFTTGASITTAFAPLGALGARLSRLFTAGAKGAKVFRILAVAVRFLLGPWGLAIAAVVGLIAWLKNLYGTNEGFRNWINGIVGAIQNFFMPVVESLKAAWQSVVDILQGGSGSGAPAWMQPLIPFFELLRSIILEVVGVFQTKLWPALQQAGQQIQAALAGAFEQLAAVWTNQLQPALAQLWSVIQSDVVPAFRKLWEVIGPIVKVIAIVVGAILGGLLFVLGKLAIFIIGTVLPAVIKFAAFLIVGWIKAITTVGTWIGTYLIKPLISLVTFLVSKVMPVWRAVADAIGTAWNWVVDTIGPIITKIRDWFANLFNPLEESKDKAGTIFETVRGWFESFWNAVLAIGQSIGDFFGRIFDPLYQAAAAIYDRVIVPIMNFFSPLADFFVTVFGIIVGIWQVAWAVISGIVTVAWAIIKAIFEIVSLIIYGIWINLVRGVTAAAEWLSERISAIFTAISEFFVSVWTTISTFLAGVWANISAVANSVWTAIVSFITGVINRVREIITSVLNRIQTIWASIWGTIGPTVTRIWNAVYSFISGIINRIRSTISSIMNSIRNTWQTAWNAVSSTVSRIWNNVMTAVSSGVSRVRGYFTGAVSWLRQAGRDIIQGLINGIGSMVTAAVNKVTSVARSVSGAIKGFFGINSPATLTIDYGKDIGKGLEIGVDRSAAGVVKSALAMVKSVSKTLGSVNPEVLLRSDSSNANARPTYLPTQSQAPSGPTVNQSVHIYNPVAARQSADVNRSLQLAGALL